jgi:hypothetical protein
MKAWISLLVVSVTVGCSPATPMKPFVMADYVATVRSARTAIPLALQMEELFPVADHFITHYGFGSSPRIWNTIIYFGGRFELSMQVDVEIDYAANRIKKIVGEPAFVLWEVKRLTLRDDGRTDAEMRGEHERHFRPAQWKLIYDSKGDLSPIGLKGEGSQVEHFDAYVSSWRRPRVAVSLLKE